MSKKNNDFLSMPEFQDIFSKMGIDATKSTFTPNIEFNRLDPQTLKILQTKGIEVPVEEITWADDGTLEYQGVKVLVYIRDQRNNMFGRKGNSYKFHVSSCKTLKKMKSGGRYNRYVVTNNTSGRFMIRQGSHEAEECLNVCHNCMDFLDYRGFKSKVRHEKHLAISNFDIEGFFSDYTNTIKDLPRYTDKNAPVDEYPENWRLIATRIKRLNNWTCQSCNLDLSVDPEYLDVHHRNAIRRDNDDRNLVALCVGCHAGQ